MLDCHCHLIDLVDYPVDVFIEGYKTSPIKQVYCNTVSAEQWGTLKKIAGQYSQVIPFFGIHPWHITGTHSDDLTVLASILRGKTSYCGEIGLDRFCKVDLSLQEEILIKQLDIAQQTKSFVSLHCVKAWGRLLDILATYKGDISFMVHSFQGTREVMERLVSMGGMISFSDYIMKPGTEKIVDVLRATPLSNVLLETDFPYQKSIAGSSVGTHIRALSDLYAFVAGVRKI